MMRSRLIATKSASAKYVHFLSKPESSYFLIMTTVGLLSGLGIVMVLSSSAVRSFAQNGSTYAIFIKQLGFMVTGLGLAYIGMRMRPALWGKLARRGIQLGAFALLLPLIPGLQRSVNGNSNWIGVGPVTIQPSEFAKLALILWCALQLKRYFEGKNAATGIQSHPAYSVAGGAAIILALILAEKDLGTATVVAGIVIGMLFVAGISYFHIGIAGAIAAVVGGALTITNENRLSRFKAIGNPFDPAIYKFAGWQPAHGLMGLASGGFFGVGIGASRQKWANLAEAHTDFIFSVIGEEMGLLGTVLVVLTYGTLVYAIFRIAINAKDLFEKFAVAGVACWIVLQVLINLFTNVGIVPVIGVTLPFISYGGSSLWASYLGIAFVLNVARRDPAVKAALSRNKKEKRSAKSE
ncbi:unannotated protein [freshwater metagenome]|uniref:peptidoglycan glycosyltransferase n=1 Tax=freshwater metagenome TaxID=449393 RepID=A0A6J7FL95_9ZZZZ